MMSRYSNDKFHEFYPHVGNNDVQHLCPVDWRVSALSGIFISLYWQLQLKDHDKEDFFGSLLKAEDTVNLYLKR